MKNMIKKFLFPDNLLYEQFDFCTCALDNKKEFFLLLESPQLICNLDRSSTSNTKEELVKDMMPTNVQEMQSKTLMDSSNRLEKRDKMSTWVDNDSNNSNSKRNKGKLRKKNRNQISLSSNDTLIHNGSFDSRTKQDEDDLDTSLRKITKTNKNQQRIKSKKKLFDTSSNIDLFAPHAEQQSKLVSKQVVLSTPLTIPQLSTKLNISEATIITWLFLKGISVTINQVVDVSIATEVAKHYGFIILNVLDDTSFNNEIPSSSFREKSKLPQGKRRPPIVTIFGHVDHGKTTLLDCICKTNSVQSEIGGITQAIKGYEVKLDNVSSSLKEKLVFLDTPGHEAFTGMRLRGAEVTDLALLVVAADDGLQPQSIESINYILSHKIPYIIAINKIDKENINLSKVRQQLADYNMLDKQWGGNSEIIEISALKALNINLLLSALQNLAHRQDLQANPNVPARGTILESHLDKRVGVVASLIVQDGTLKKGDMVVSGTMYGRVKVIIDSHGSKIDQALPSAVVNILGFSSMPHAGLKFFVVQGKKDAKMLASQNLQDSNSGISNILNTRVTLDSYSDTSKLKIVNVILKADTQGSLEAIINSFAQIRQEKVQINILAASSGSVSNTDIELAITSQSIILGFNITISSNLRRLAERSGVLIHVFGIIYSLLDYTKEYMLSLIEPEYKQSLIGKATVQTVFNINKGTVAGCVVDSGRLKKHANINIYGEKSLLHSGKIDSLKRLKDDVEEVIAGNECGVMCSNYYSWKPSNIIEVYELIEKNKVL
uniref:translation initiation factor 2 n=1 Tax=Catenella fusiformis TaxID=3024791 RepID=UPI0027DA9A90|nr:translation initiation factor 2 [Catenella fusiformis]WCH57528.1 translation initiation factor 2 [Catenella fusiformis]